MAYKHVPFDSAARETILSGATQLTDPVRVTLDRGSKSMTKAPGSPKECVECSAQPRDGGDAPVSAPTRPRSSGHRPEHRPQPRVAWPAAIAIASMLVLAAGWELWRWILLILTLD